jgi:hypothetical protein
MRFSRRRPVPIGDRVPVTFEGEVYKPRVRRSTTIVRLLSHFPRSDDGEVASRSTGPGWKMWTLLFLPPHALPDWDVWWYRWPTRRARRFARLVSLGRIQCDRALRRWGWLRHIATQDVVIWASHRNLVLIVGAVWRINDADWRSWVEQQSDRCKYWSKLNR